MTKKTREHLYFYKAFYLQLLATTVFGLGGIIFNATQQFLQSMLFASFVMSVNVFLLCWSLKRLFMKKSIAMSLGIIVFKWAILAYLLYLYFNNFEVHLIGLLVGLSTVIVSVVMWLFFKNPFEERV